MKKLIALVAFIAPLAAQAKIAVYAQVTYSESTEVEATQLTKTLKTLGSIGYTDKYGYERMHIRGDITVTNGAACDNGHQTYSINLTSLGEDNQELGTVTLDKNSCTKLTSPAKFYALMQQWGGNILMGDCGAGHCWQKIDNIECTHYKGDARTKPFDSCSVSLSTGE